MEQGASAGKGMKIAVIIPTMNEPAIGKVVGETRDTLKGWDLDVIVVDRSTDDTGAEASAAGARVIRQEDVGYGDAYIVGFRNVSPATDIVVMIDGDDTYDPRDIPLLIGPILEKRADIVLGNRFAHMDRGAMSARNRLGNRAITDTINLLFRLKLRDSQTGYRALRAGALRELAFVSDGMPFASEMIIEAHIKSLSIAEVPVSYRRRVGRAKMKAYRDGSLILGLVIRLARRHNPLRLFLLVGGLLMLGGVALWTVVFEEWLSTGIIHRLASVAGGTLLFLAGLQIIIFGLLAGILVATRQKR
jgi:glycosyltransferase involved in cell wall biosynthesis